MLRNPNARFVTPALAHMLLEDAIEGTPARKCRERSAVDIADKLIFIMQMKVLYSRLYHYDVRRVQL